MDLRQDVERLGLWEVGSGKEIIEEKKILSWRSQDKGSNVHALCKEV